MVLSQLHGAFKGTVERITGPRVVSAFKEKGVLSVTEFVLAGDNLVSKCPTWSWESGEPSKRKSYLPADKQFLITRNVPCLRRASSIEEEYEAAGGEILLENDDDDDGWLATHGRPKETKADEENLPSMDSLEISKGKAIQSISSYFGGEDEDHIPDMEDFEDQDNVIENDPATLHSTYLVAQEPDEENILRTRTYDVSITYDKYYQTPRVWLTGYDESRMLLRPELVLEDVSQDHARKTGLRRVGWQRTIHIPVPKDKEVVADETSAQETLMRDQLQKVSILLSFGSLVIISQAGGLNGHNLPVSKDKDTVTIEHHPHLPGKHASIHPCQHGAVMKKIIDVLMSRGVEPEVDRYLFIFLKFMASVIPTIEYDYTMDFDLGSSSS